MMALVLLGEDNLEFARSGFLVSPILFPYNSS
jgi:hypothetical protein